jgi:hypothetical protein
MAKKAGGLSTGGDSNIFASYILGSNPSLLKRLTTSATSKVRNYDVKEKDFDSLIEG